MSRRDDVAAQGQDSAFDGLPASRRKPPGSDSAAKRPLFELSAAQGRRWPRAWRVFLWALAALAFLEAPARYPNLSFHGFLGALPWPVYVVQGCVWSYLGWSLGRGR